MMGCALILVDISHGYAEITESFDKVKKRFSGSPGMVFNRELYLK